jgi:predicted RNA binding protein YcfA (HicA-like mRNA interferase family)
MARFPKFVGREMIQVLLRGGFEVVRFRGSHHLLQHPDGRTTVIPVHVGEQIGSLRRWARKLFRKRKAVPVHSGEQLGPGLMRAILRDCDMTVQEFGEL